MNDYGICGRLRNEIANVDVFWTVPTIDLRKSEFRDRSVIKLTQWLDLRTFLSVVHILQSLPLLR